LGQTAKHLTNIEKVFDDQISIIRNIVTALRLHQWSKNVLIFVPLLASHKVNQPALLLTSAFAFLAFSLCASSVYVLNDLLDLSVDRQHTEKQYRPFAAGTLSVKWGLAIFPSLLLSAFALALGTLPPTFAAVLAIYYLATLGYSLGLKTIPIVDILLLSGLYTLRVIAGAAVISIQPSFWLLAFSVFLFLSLATVKPYAELLDHIRDGGSTRAGRGYIAADLNLLGMLGTSSGYLSVLVLVLYVNSPEVVDNYRHPQLIWLLCPILLYWISRIWMKTCRGRMRVDPVVFAFKDPVSHLLAAITAAVLVSAIAWSQLASWWM